MLFGVVEGGENRQGIKKVTKGDNLINCWACMAAAYCMAELWMFF